MTNWKYTPEAYDAIIDEARTLMLAKNHDYGDSWRLMRPTSLTDEIHVKVERIIQLETLAAQGSGPRVSEGIESEYRDIINFAVFALIKLKEAELGI